MNPDLESLPLRDIHLPDSVAWWPIAPGWWVIVILILFGFALVIYLKKLKEQRKLRVAGLIELEKIGLEYDRHRDAYRLVADISVLLRRICISHSSQQNAKQKVANLTGKKWLAFLERGIEGLQLKGNVSFISGAGRVLVTIPYRPDNNAFEAGRDVDVESLLLLCRSWIKALPIEPKSTWATTKRYRSNKYNNSTVAQA